MGAWDDLSVDVSQVRGLAESLFTDRQSASFDASEVIDDTDPAAKGELQDVLLHPDYGDLGEHVSDAGGPEKLLDALANDAELQSRLKRGHALAVVAMHAEDEAIISGGQITERSNSARDRIREWAQSFGQIAPYQLGYTSTSRTSGGGAFAGTMDSHG